MKEWDNKTSAKYVAKQWVSLPLQLQGEKNPGDWWMQGISLQDFNGEKNWLMSVVNL